MSEIQYRFANPADPNELDALVNLRLLMQREVNALAGDVEADFARDIRAYFVRAFADRTYESAVAVADRSLVAATGLVLYDKPPSLSGRRGRQGLITNVFTDPAWRGRGVSTTLMTMTIERARERGADRLHLGATELGASVYKRVGFRPPRFTYLELKVRE